MLPLALLEFHQGLNARFTEVNGQQVVNDYGGALAEHAALRETAGALDLSFRGRLCLTGADRVRFLNGQVTNNVKDLRAGPKAVTPRSSPPKAKWKATSTSSACPTNCCWTSSRASPRKSRNAWKNTSIADDVQIVDAAPHYGLLSVQGPKAETAVRAALACLQKRFRRNQCDLHKIQRRHARRNLCDEPASHSDQRDLICSSRTRRSAQ